MGTNSTCGYQSYPLGPAGQPAPPRHADIAPPGPTEQPGLVGQLAALTALTPPGPGEKPGHGYDDLVHAAAEVQSALDAASVGAGELAHYQKGLSQATGEYLGGLTTEQLRQLATDHGFDHAGLIGAGPLAHWLDPAYPPDSPSKAKVKAAAQDRYDAACAAGAAGPAGPPGSAPVGPGGWQASPGEIVAAQAAIADAATAYSGLSVLSQDKPAALAALIAAENRLATADCPALGAGLDQAKAAARHQVSAALGSVGAGQITDAVQAGTAAGHLTDGQAAVLTPSETVALLRQNTASDQRQALADTAATRASQLAALTAAHAAFSPYKPGVNSPLVLAGPDQDQPAAVADFASAAHSFLSTKAAVKTWSDGVPGLTGFDAPDALKPTAAVWAGDLTKDFRAWAKDQKLADLRTAAAQMGMAGAHTATRAQVQNHIAAHWDPALTKGPPTTPPPAASPVFPPQGPGQDGARTPGQFAATHRSLVAALQHATATTADLPHRHDPGTVASWTFGPGTAATLGGAHAKALHRRCRCT